MWMIGVEQLGDGHVGVVDPYERGGDGVFRDEVFLHYDDGSRFLIDIVGVFGVAQEGDTAFLALFDDAGLPHPGVFVAVDGAFHHLGQFFRCILHTLVSSFKVIGGLLNYDGVASITYNP